MATAVSVCEGCSIDPWETFCIQCEQFFCKKCTTFHMRQKATRAHSLVEAINHDKDFSNSTIDSICNACVESNLATSLCLDCKEVFCDACRVRHLSLKATKHHNVIAAMLIPAVDMISLADDQSSGTERHVNIVPSSNMACAQVQVGKGRFYGVFAHEFMNSARGDKEVTRVRGIAILTDGRIVVADYKNKSLKLFNSDFNFVTAKDVKDDPRGMAYQSPDDRVAVTFADKKEVRIYRIENNKIQKHKTFKMKERPFSIAYNKNYFAIEVGEGEDGAIHIVDVNGHMRAIIPGFTRSYGQFTGNTIRLALDYAKEIVYVVDIVNESVHSLNFGGTFMWSTKVPSPRGIVLNNDILFVASSNTNKIYQMSVESGLLYSFMDEDNRIKRPRYIAYQPALKKLAAEIDGNHIKIYNISEQSSESAL